MIQHIECPILIYNNQFIQGQLKNTSELCRRTKKSVGEKLFDSLVIIDSDGNQFEVLVYIGRFNWATFFMNVVDLTLDLFMRPKEELSTWVEFELTEPKKVDFDKAKQQIADLLCNNPKWFKKTYEQTDSIEEKLGAYESLNELINSFAGYP